MNDHHVQCTTPVWLSKAHECVCMVKEELRSGAEVKANSKIQLNVLAYRWLVLFSWCLPVLHRHHVFLTTSGRISCSRLRTEGKLVFHEFVGLLGYTSI